MLRRVLCRAASHLDRAVHAAVVRGTTPPETLEHLERMLVLEEIRALYDRPEHLDTPSTFFLDPSPPTLLTSRERSLRGGRSAELPSGRGWAGRTAHGAVIDAFWRSGFRPHCDEIAERYLAHEPNCTAAARLYLHGDRPRPAVVLIHGYGGGHWGFEERVWPVSWFFERGLDVALAVLPFHGVRFGGRGFPLFPSRTDPRFTIEGFRQAVFDVRSLIRHLQHRGAPAVGLVGMSLGGYTTSLLATVEPRIAFAIPMIPLASIADFYRQSGEMAGTEEERKLQYEAITAAFRAVSPLSRPAILDRERILVIGGAGDRITPIDHARRLAQHFDAPLEIFHGGHLLQLGRLETYRAVDRLLERLGLIERRARAA